MKRLLGQLLISALERRGYVVGRRPPNHPNYEGPFASWAVAEERSSGWTSPVITAKVLESAQRVKAGEAPFEQDTVLRDTVLYSPTILAFLLLAKARAGARLDVVDVGGSLGTNFIQNRKLLEAMGSFHWNVVELPDIAKVGNEQFAGPSLSFFSSLGEAEHALGSLRFCVFTGSLQYFQDPAIPLNTITRARAEVVAFDRLVVSPTSQHEIYVQRPDPTLTYAATYPIHCFSRDRFVEQMQDRGFRLLELFTSYPGVTFDVCGMIFVRD